MDRLTLTARLRLTSTDARGRKTPIRSNYRPTFDLGLSWMGKPALNDGRIMLIDQDELAPGAEGVVCIEPLFSEFWAAVREGCGRAGARRGTDRRSRNSGEGALRPGFTPSVAIFVWKASEFCTFIQEAGQVPIDERMSGRGATSWPCTWPP
jgi:hypothetical protein